MSHMLLYGLFYVAALLGLSLLGIHIAVVMGIISVAGALALFGWVGLSNIGTLVWSTSNEYLLVAIPMFILLGEILLRAGISDRMYQALAAWMNRLPGGLLHTNIVSSALFAATSGSSVATAATIGTIALPALEERRYDERLALGTICAGGTLGILIPPSVNMIIYAAITDTSIGRLFLAGIVPGIVLTLLFMALVVALVLIRPASGGERRATAPLAERLRLLVDLVPPLLVFAIVMGSIYGGLATATEAAALGVLAALALAGARRRLTVAVLHAAFRSTVRVTGMVMLIVATAFFLNFVLSLGGVPQAVTRMISDLGASPIVTIWVLVLIYLVLGMFLETFSMMITTIPIVTPVVVAMGFDPVWFGVFIVLMCELALITPPIGMNLYVVQGIRPRRGPIGDVFAGTLPFVGALLVMTALLIYWPALALWLPGLLF